MQIIVKLSWAQRKSAIDEAAKKLKPTPCNERKHMIFIALPAGIVCSCAKTLKRKRYNLIQYINHIFLL